MIEKRSDFVYAVVAAAAVQLSPACSFIHSPPSFSRIPPPPFFLFLLFLLDSYL